MAVELLKKSYVHKIMEMQTIPVTEAKIINIIKSLKPKNS
jgi:hypothetical protein